MNIKLNWIHLKNFKGIKDFKLVADGKNVSVFADNGKGKTTLMDAFLWLLFNKDSNDSTNFTVKPQDSLGQDIHHLQTEVEAELLIDGTPLKLKKAQVEKWETPRGQSEARFTGNKLLYWYNEVPTKATEYNIKVDDLINENIFKMITNPLYFNTKLKWEERRKILLEISGDATDEQVIASDESLTELTEYLNGRSIDDYKLVLADKLKGFKKERDNLPPRIDELTRSLPQEDPDYEAVETEMNKHKETLAGIEFLMTNASNKANELSKKHQELYSLKNQLEKVKAKIKAEQGTQRTELTSKVGELNNGAILLTQNIKALENQIEDYERDIKYYSNSLAGFREEWTSLNNKKSEILKLEFIEDGLTTHCPTCNQSLPVENLDNQRAELKVNFEKDKNLKIESINSMLNLNKENGLSMKTNLEQTTKNKELAEKEVSEKKAKLDLLRIELSATETVLSEPVPLPDYTKYPEMIELSTKIDNLTYELDKPVEDKSSELLARKSDIQVKIDELNKVLNGKAEIEKKKTRIEELKADEKRVSTLIAELEGHKFLLERFSTAKANLLEDSINIQFKHVRFKLFEENITNEGIKDTCIALVNTNGAYVKFEDANSAGRINAGIDVINALNKFYGVVAPIFTDNAESVTDLADTESQVIKLIKPEIRNEEDRNKYSQLVVEVQE